jgi:hypothetical protein
VKRLAPAALGLLLLASPALGQPLVFQLGVVVGF